jgi:hypothetical protein
MPQPGRELKARLAALMGRHNVRPIERAPIPLLPPTPGPQIIEGVAASAGVDAERMSFKSGSLSWPDDPGKIPFLIRHDPKRVAGRILDLDYRPDGRVFVRARVDDVEGRRMGGFSIAATVIESEVRDEDSPAGFHFVITKAIVDEISATDRPANARAIVTSRRDVAPWDDRRSHDELMASLRRVRKGLEDLQAVWPAVKSPDTTHGSYFKSEVTFAEDRPLLNIAPAPAHIYGTLPRAVLQRKRTVFGQLVSRLPVGGE